MYTWYGHLYEPKTSSSVDVQFSICLESTKHETTRSKPAKKAREDAFKTHLREKNSIEAKHEVEKYLAEGVVDAGDAFDVLDWWKSNISIFRILSLIA